MTDYRAKSYGRNDEVGRIYRHFENGRDVAMPGPRRLGKSFVLDRVVDAGSARGWHAVKVEVAGCTDVKGVFQRLCDRIGRNQSGGTIVGSWILQRLGQLTSPRSEPNGAWYQPLIGLDHETWFERLVATLNGDTKQRWAVLIDELPIFLKSLHDRGPEGVARARDFMNFLSRLRDDNKNVRWLVTGSIGLEPLARAGNYLGVLAKFESFELQPLSRPQAMEFVMDLASNGQLPDRARITAAEAEAIVDAVGWRAAYYLDALSQKLAGDPGEGITEAGLRVNDAIERLLQPAQLPTFGTWEEHIRKHYEDPDRGIAFAVLAALAPHPQGLSLDNILTSLKKVRITTAQLRAVLERLQAEGFVTVHDWGAASPVCAFLNPLLRRWWQRFPPSA